MRVYKWLLLRTLTWATRVLRGDRRRDAQQCFLNFSPRGDRFGETRVVFFLKNFRKNHVCMGEIYTPRVNRVFIRSVFRFTLGSGDQPVFSRRVIKNPFNTRRPCRRDKKKYETSIEMTSSSLREKRMPSSEIRCGFVIKIRVFYRSRPFIYSCKSVHRRNRPRT